VTGRDHVQGLPHAPVTLLEYGDYQCAGSKAAHGTVAELLRLRRTTLRFVYRHFPLTTIHPHAESAAQIAEAAEARRRFWPMHDWLFTNQDLVDLGYVNAGCPEVGLPVVTVSQEIEAEVYLDVVRQDFVGGTRSGVNTTPTFFVNGVRYDGRHELDDLLAAVDVAGAG
jgi:protein-disulfide isomerase